MENAAPICSLSLIVADDDVRDAGALDDGFANAELSDGFADAMPALPMVFSLPLVEDEDVAPRRIAG